MHRNAGKQVRIGGFTNSDIQVMDVTNPNNVRKVAGTVEPTATGYAVTFKTAGTGRRSLFAFTEDQIKTPVAVVANQPSSWHASGTGYDFVAISHKDFADSLQISQRLEGVSETACPWLWWMSRMSMMNLASEPRISGR